MSVDRFGKYPRSQPIQDSQIFCAAAPAALDPHGKLFQFAKQRRHGIGVLGERLIDPPRQFAYRRRAREIGIGTHAGPTVRTAGSSQAARMLLPGAMM